MLLRRFPHGRSFLSKSPRGPRRRRLRLEVEGLEDRLSPATFNLLTNPAVNNAGAVAELIAAVNAANNEGVNPGADTIVPFGGGTYTFTGVDNFWYGPNALPAITSVITIQGNGATLQRDPALGTTTPFRLFYV